jgi:hypothetical protein
MIVMKTRRMIEIGQVDLSGSERPAIPLGTYALQSSRYP